MATDMATDMALRTTCDTEELCGKKDMENKHAEATAIRLEAIANRITLALELEFL